MRRSGPPSIAAAVSLALVISACGRVTPSPPATPPEPERGTTPQAAAATADTVRPRRGEADARFMQRMIAHHAQALEMTALVPARTARADIRLLAERIDVSQRDEIAVMRRWLAARGEPVPRAGAPHEHHATGGEPPMPGMLTAEEMTRLAQASGAAFDRLFLESMIRHHEGALRMVAELFATPGAGQESEIFAFASEVDADQRAEIARMRALLSTLQ